MMDLCYSSFLLKGAVALTFASPRRADVMIPFVCMSKMKCNHLKHCLLFTCKTLLPYALMNQKDRKKCSYYNFMGWIFNISFYGAVTNHLPCSLYEHMKVIAIILGSWSILDMFKMLFQGIGKGSWCHVAKWHVEDVSVFREILCWLHKGHLLP